MKNLIQLYQKYLPFHQKYFGLVFRISLMIILIVLYYELSGNFYSCGYSFGNSAKESGEKFYCIFKESLLDLELLFIFLAVSYVLFWFAKKDK